MPHLVVERYAVPRGVAGHIVVCCHVAKVRRMRGGTDIRGYR